MIFKKAAKFQVRRPEKLQIDFAWPNYINYSIRLTVCQPIIQRLLFILTVLHV